MGFFRGVDSDDALGGTGLFDNGTAALPSISFLNDPDTGIYRIGANNIGFSTNGVLAGDVSATGWTFALPVSALGFIPTSSTATGNRFYLRTTNRPALSVNSVKALEWGESAGVPFIILGGAAASLLSLQADFNDGSVAYSGGSGSGAGANMVVYGGTHATKANDFEFRTDTTNRLVWDHSALTWIMVGRFSNTSATVASTATIAQLTATASHVLISGATGTTIQGILAGVAGQRMTITSAGAAVTIANQNAGATAADRIVTATGADLVGTSPCNFDLIYDATATRWVCVSSSL